MQILDFFKFKKCNKCGEIKRMSLFSKNKNKKDGYQSECKACRKKMQQEYRKTEEGKKANYRGTKRHMKKSPEKVKARMKLNYSLKKNKIEKPIYCQHCKKKKFLEAHHEDYNKPLNVVWLCKQCHAKEHERMKKGN